MKLHTLIALTALTGFLHAGTNAPQTPPSTAMTTSTDSDWSFRFAPYGWVTAIDGDIGIGHLTSPVDVSMSDTINSLDMTYMAIMEASYGKWSFGLDVIYAKLSQDIGGGGHLFDSFRLQQKQWLITPIVAYNVVETNGYRMDVFAGARFTSLEVDLTGRFVGSGEVTAGRSTDWTDPIVGIRGQANLTDKLFFRYYGDIGGFGVGSDFTWQAFAGVGYQVSKNVGIAAGYRALGVDYTKDLFSMDTVSHGPVLGLEIRF